MKQVILVREDIDMSTGKTVAQGSHASVNAVQEADSNTVSEWLSDGGKKITLKVRSEKELRDIIESADNLPTSIISDLGHTELDPGTITAGAIGPASSTDIDSITGHLPLLD